MAVGVLVVSGSSALAHHSFSMFDFGAPTNLEGTVQEFRYTSPHTFIILKVRGKDGNVATWTLEGNPPTALERDGWTRATLKPGDQIRLTVSPARSGTTGGMWSPGAVHFRDGKTAGR
ncbi:MAG TPA: DUF6152 family protein [Xanthobacteraceae bacterium]